MKLVALSILSFTGSSYCGKYCFDVSSQKYEALMGMHA
ncbi:hypothetical protein BVRB_7g175070 [Beta vulgaris subsp. vulgaris]|nr:hypothetical protein BVRB_7g175070 [Beta vulgaris subsp. vulgaris]